MIFCMDLRYGSAVDLRYGSAWIFDMDYYRHSHFSLIHLTRRCLGLLAMSARASKPEVNENPKPMFQLKAATVDDEAPVLYRHRPGQARLRSTEHLVARNSDKVITMRESMASGSLGS